MLAYDDKQRDDDSCVDRIIERWGTMQGFRSCDGQR